MDLYQDITALYPSFNKIPQTYLSTITEVIFSYRDGINSICVVFNNSDAIKAISVSVPDDIINQNAFRYMVDLESLGSDKERYYTDIIGDEEISLVGWYVNDASIYQKKIYRRIVSGGLEVDRYDASGSLISSGEGEVQTVDDDWKGYTQALEIAKTYSSDSIGYLVLKKTDVDQSYIRLYGINN